VTWPTFILLLRTAGWPVKQRTKIVGLVTTTSIGKEDGSGLLQGLSLQTGTGVNQIMLETKTVLNSMVVVALGGGGTIFRVITPRDISARNHKKMASVPAVGIPTDTDATISVHPPQLGQQDAINVGIWELTLSAYPILQKTISFWENLLPLAIGLGATTLSRRVNGRG